MRVPGRVLNGELQGRQGRRGEGAADIRYLTVKGGLGELRELGFLDGIQAMANRVFVGQSWWVAGHRSSIECLYRKQSRACPTTFVIAIAAGTEGTNNLTGREADRAAGGERDGR